jgi:hypothetical protein
MSSTGSGQSAFPGASLSRLSASIGSSIRFKRCLDTTSGGKVV